MVLHWLSVLFMQQGSPGTILQTNPLPGCGGPIARHLGTGQAEAMLPGGAGGVLRLLTELAWL